jgi:hypothetical protein
MNNSLTLGYMPKWLYILLAISLSAFSLMAQTKPANKTETTAVNVVLRGGTIVNLTSRIIDTTGSFVYSLINLKFDISGKTPKADVPVKLSITDFSDADPEFYSPSGSSVNYTITISKSLFQSNGKGDSTLIPVTIRFNKVVSKGGSAYIKILGHPEFSEMVFATKAPIKKTSQNLGITLVDSTTVLTLDTFKKNTANQFPVKLYIKLNKGTGSDTQIKIVPHFVDAIKNIKLSENEPNGTYIVKIASSDWNSKKDTVVNKNINLYIHQTAPIINEEDITLHIDSAKDLHIIKLMPSKAKAKNLLYNPVEPGNAEIISGKIALSHYTGPAVNSIDTLSIKVKVYGKYKKNHNQLSFALLDTSLSKHFQIIESIVTINQRDWDTAINRYNRLIIIDSLGKAKKQMKPKDTAAKINSPSPSTKRDTILEGILIIPLHIKTINLVDSVNNIQYLDIILVGQNQLNKGSQRVNLSKKDKPFWAEIGTNFDLLDNIKTNNFYAGVYMFDKDIARIGGKKGNNNISFTGGVYESQSVSLSSTADMPYTYKNYNPITQKYAGYRDTGSISTTTSIKNIGLFFSPQVRLTNGKVEENGVHLFISIYTEMLWQRITSSFNYPPPTAALTALPDSTNLSKFSSKQSSLSLDYRSQYYGIGIPVYIKHKDFNLYLNWVPLGFTTQQFVFVQDNYAPDYNTKFPYRPIPATQNNSNYDIYLLNYARPKNVWNAFFIIQYRLNEVAYGITFSGEIRSLYLQGSKPVITLALSKKFDLSAVLKPVIGAF